ncbi:hypothetical protein OPU71_14240 [Niveibacterium sp. 24ML]|uniref:hypothetical protein n=1 Tax=Niveibacterium sp. 24ML TaxID=2985512 RepID=UPI00226D52C6|nr:hypothetical protein [Niveibacterium sp. 24ML]MCX9157284.1 hypothetical protein [Niveibacterium sp. 24ML]
MAIAQQSNSPTRKRLHVIAGKGGVGKSMLARALIWASAERRIKLKAFDGDGSNASLKRFHQDADVVDVDGDGLVAHWYEQRVVPSLLNSAGSSVLLDLGAGAERLFRRWAAQNEAAALLQDYDAEIVIWHVLEPSLDSVSPLLDTLSVLPEVRHIVALNLGLARGIHTYDPEAAFKPLLSEPEFLEAAHGKSILRLPPLLDAGLLDRHDLSFADALKPDSPLSIFERARVRKWLTTISAPFAQCL